MTPNQFRKMALALPNAIESAHMDHPDFRVNDRIFATLGYPNKHCGMVKLTPDQQRKFLKKAPDVFNPCSGAWGRRGATSVQLALARNTMLRQALKAAWQNVSSPVKA